jgi:plastocyanin
MKARSWLSLLIGVCTWVQWSQAQITVDIHIYDFDFGTAGHTPSDPSIQIGDKIRWIWDAPLHSTTSAAGQAESWDSGVQSAPFTFEHTFTQAGTFSYYCTPHGVDLGGGNVGGMSGFITVVPEPQAWGMAAGLLLVGFMLVRRRRQRLGALSSEHI